uniref:Uncharacterized protein n=1 Tax=Oryza punctata TaxID=4537 RepID=A0A0E0JGA7_ORYPU
MKRRRMVPHRCAVPVLATSMPLVLDDTDLLPDDGGGRPKFSPSRTTPHRCVVPMLVTFTPLVNDVNLLPNDGGTPLQILWRDVADVISRILAVHPSRSSVSVRGDGTPPSHLPRRPPLLPLLGCEAAPSAIAVGRWGNASVDGDRGRVGER